MWSMKKERKFRWAYTSKGIPVKVKVDEIDNAIDKYSKKQWEESYAEGWRELAQKGRWERLRYAIKEEVRGYMMVNNISAKEAVEAVRRSRLYKSQEDFYQTEMYYKINKQGWDRDKGRFALKKKNIIYQGKVEIDGMTYTKYKYTLNNGEIWYTYEADSPKQASYQFWRSQTNYE